MSSAVTALNGVTFQDGIAVIAEAPLQGMITLRGDLSVSAVTKAATRAGGVRMPGPGQAHVDKDSGLCWMSPDEALILCPYDDVADTLAKLNTALAKVHALAVDVSDARAMFRVSGKGAREVMAKLAPVDFRPAVFTPGTFRRTRLAQVAAAFWMREEEVFDIICFRSNARYVFDVLCVAAQKDSRVNHF